MGKDQWVSPRGDKWAVHGAGNSKDTKLFDTQRQAQDYAIGIAKNQKSEVVVQGRDGKFVPKTAMVMTRFLHVTPSINHT